MPGPLATSDAICFSRDLTAKYRVHHVWILVKLSISRSFNAQSILFPRLKSCRKDIGQATILL